MYEVEFKMDFNDIKVIATTMKKESGKPQKYNRTRPSTEKKDRQAQ